MGVCDICPARDSYQGISFSKEAPLTQQSCHTTRSAAPEVAAADSRARERGDSNGEANNKYKHTTTTTTITTTITTNNDYYNYQ